MRDRVYSSASDVWAYGVVLYECINRKDPYPDMDAFGAGAAVAYKGLVLDLPDEKEWPLCRKIMQSCFEQEPSKRPSMNDIVNMFEKEEL